MTEATESRCNEQRDLSAMQLAVEHVRNATTATWRLGTATRKSAIDIEWRGTLGRYLWRGVVVSWCRVVVVSWCCGVVVLWCCGAVVLWCCGVVVGWFLPLLVIGIVDGLLLVFEAVAHRQ